MDAANRKEDFEELIQYRQLAELRDTELVKVIKELREAFLKVCTQHDVEANSYKAYLNSLRY